MRKVQFTDVGDVLLAALGIVAIAVAAVGVRSGSAEAQELARQQVLRYADLSGEVTSFDAAFAVSSNNRLPIENVFSALVRFKPGTIDVSQLEPELAERWEVSADGTTWTFHLRRGVQFHKGLGELTADDVRFSYERLNNPKLGAPWKRPNIKAIHAVGKYTIRIELHKPDAFFLHKVANIDGGQILSRKAVEQAGVVERDMKLELRAVIGTGPFQVEQLIAGQRLVLSRHDKYFRGSPILERVEYVRMPDLNSRLLALKNRQVEAIGGSFDGGWVAARVQEGFRPVGRLGDPWVLHLNLTQKPFDDIRVRKAMAHAVERSELARYYQGLTEPYYAYVSPFVLGGLSREEVPEELRYGYNLDLSRKLLAEAGLPKGFEFSYGTNPVFLPLATLLQAQFGRVGIRMKIETLTWEGWVAKSKEGANPVEIFSPLYLTPDAVLRSLFHSASAAPAGVNYSRYGKAIPGIDDLIDKAPTTGMDMKKLQEVYRDLQLRILRDLPAIPTVYTARPYWVAQPYLDFGFEPKASHQAGIYFTEKTRILAR